MRSPASPACTCASTARPASSAWSATSSSPPGTWPCSRVEVIAAAVLPNLVDTEPGFVNDVVAAAAGGTPTGDIGGLQTLFNVAGAGYILGGLLFGIALFRTRILARWAAALLAVSTVGTAALAVLPDSFNRPFAVPEGIALIALGVSLWRNVRRTTRATAAESPAATAQAEIHAV